MNYQNQLNMAQRTPLLPPPPSFLMPEVNAAPPVQDPSSFIGPVVPENTHQNEDMNIEDDDDCAIVSTTPSNKNNSQDAGSQDQRGRERNNDRDNRRDRDNKDRGRQQRFNRDRFNRDQNRDRSPRRNDRNDRSNDRGDRNDRNRDRRSKWSDRNSDDSNKAPLLPNPNNGNSGGPNMMMPGAMMQYNMMGQPQPPMNMNNMPGMNNMPLMPNMPVPSNMGNMAPNMGNMGPNMGNMGPNMGNMVPNMGNVAPNMPIPPNMANMAPNMPIPPNMNNMGPNMGNMGPNMGNMGPNMGPNMGNMGQNMGNMPNMGMNMMMPNMMDPNAMMMNTMMQKDQPMYVTNAILMPPLPGVSMPNRRERPLGCRTIFVGGLPQGVTREVLQEIFEHFGGLSDIKIHSHGSCHIRFEKQESVEHSFILSGYRFKFHDMTENEATTLFVDYALNREDQNEYERNKRLREPTPPRVEPCTPANLTQVSEKIKSDEQFATAAPILAVWLERGECNKRNANTFYSMIQASNNQVRRLCSEKMSLDEEYQNAKVSIREKFASVITQFEQVAKILKAARLQRVSDLFTKQQRRNIEMWLKMTEEVDNIKEEFNAIFDDEETERAGRNVVPLEKYEELKAQLETLNYELEGYRNEAHLAKDEAERKFEKFKAQYIAHVALQTKSTYPPLPPPPPLPQNSTPSKMQKTEPPPPPPPGPGYQQPPLPPVTPSEAKIISILTAFLLVHPLGASLENLAAYVRSLTPAVTQAHVSQVLQKYTEIFRLKPAGYGTSMINKWEYVTFDIIKSEVK